jgi:hypothetical protein
MQSLKPPRALVVGAGWLAAALVATLAGLIGIRLVGESLTSTPGGVRSEAEVARELAAATPTTSPTATTPAPTSTGPARSQFTSAGGTVSVHCEPGDRAFLDSWSPRPGYQVRDYNRGPGDDVEVRFEGANGRVELKFVCRDGVPVPEPRHGGGGDDD